MDCRLQRKAEKRFSNGKTSIETKNMELKTTWFSIWNSHVGHWFYSREWLNISYSLHIKWQVSGESNKVVLAIDPCERISETVKGTVIDFKWRRFGREKRVYNYYTRQTIRENILGQSELSPRIRGWASVRSWKHL